MRTFVCRVVLARVRRGSASFSYDFQLREPCILIATPSSISSEKLAKSLGIRPPIVSGFSEGNYRIRLIARYSRGLEESEYVIK